ncbi:MAG: AAA family ATPase [candidate division WOR-3 bacterium]
MSVQSTSKVNENYLSKFEERYRRIEISLKDKEKIRQIYKDLKNGMAIDTDLSTHPLLLRHDEFYEKLFEIKKEIEKNQFQRAYAVVGEYGTGKTQFAYFIANMFREKRNVRAVYKSLCSVEDIRNIEHEVQNYLKQGVNLVLLLDDLDSLLSSVESDEIKRKIAGELAGFIQRVSFRPYYSQGGFVGVSSIFLMHTSTLRKLLQLDDRLRRIEERINLDKISEPEDGEELAINILAFLCYLEDDLHSSIMRCGESLIRSLARWAKYYVENFRKISYGLFIRDSFYLFDAVLRHLGDCPKEGTSRGIYMQKFITEMLYGQTVGLSIKDKDYCLRIEPSTGGPDLRILLYTGNQAIGSPVLEVSAEVKCVKDSIKEYESQIARYTGINPLLLIIVAEDEEKVEEQASELSKKYPMTYLEYPLALFEPLSLIKDPSKSSNILQALVGKSILDDIRFKVELFYEQKLVEKGTMDLTSVAKVFIDKANFRNGKKKNYGNLKKSLDEAAKNIKLEIDLEKVLSKILEALTQNGFMEQISQKQYRPFADEWRKRKEEAENLIASILEKY